MVVKLTKSLKMRNTDQIIRTVQAREVPIFLASGSTHRTIKKIRQSAELMALKTAKLVLPL